MKPGTGFPCPTCLNEMIKNINKRKELAEMTYGNYAGVLSAEEKNELENEVGAAFSIPPVPQRGRLCRPCAHPAALRHSPARIRRILSGVPARADRPTLLPPADISPTIRGVPGKVQHPLPAAISCQGNPTMHPFR